MLPGPSWQQQTRHPRPAPDTLADEESTKEAGLLVHVHSRRVGHCDKQAIAGAEREQPPLVGGVQGVLGAPGPAGGPACFHQQDGSWVGAHLLGEEQVSFSKFTCLHRFNRNIQSAFSGMSPTIKSPDFVYYTKAFSGRCLQVPKSCSDPRICLYRTKQIHFNYDPG